MGFEPTTIRDLVGCTNHWATGDCMVSEGQFMGLNWNRSTRLHSQVMIYQRIEKTYKNIKCSLYRDEMSSSPTNFILVLVIWPRFFESRLALTHD